MDFLLGYNQPIAPGFKLAFMLLLLWSFFWKGLALWNSAKNEDKYWFIALLVLNTMGILEIVYLFFFEKNKTSKIFLLASLQKIKKGDFNKLLKK